MELLVSSMVGLGAGDLNGSSCLMLNGRVGTGGRWPVDDLRRRDDSGDACWCPLLGVSDVESLTKGLSLPTSSIARLFAGGRSSVGEPGSRSV